MTGIIILAAGASARLGSPKQNLIYRGATLIQKVVDAALSSVCRPVIVVLGANAAVIEPSIKDKPVHIEYNAEWPEGMASSIRAGIQALQKLEPGLQSVILLLCDQPFVDAALINALVKANTGNKTIVACAYDETTGAPVLFGHCYIDELLSLTGHEGAKKLLLKYADNVVSIPFAAGAMDIDTIGDYQALINDTDR